MLYAPPPSAAGKKEEEIAQLCPVVSSAPKVNITENDGKNKEWAKRWNRSEQSVKTRHPRMERPLISQSHQVITPGDFPAWQKEGLISQA